MWMTTQRQNCSSVAANVSGPCSFPPSLSSALTGVGHGEQEYKMLFAIISPLWEQTGERDLGTVKTQLKMICWGF